MAAPAAGAPGVPRTIIHVPHSSSVISDEERALMLVSDAVLQNELLRMTDAYTDELFDVDPGIASSLVFPVSRLVVDVERFGDDTMEPMHSRGMGAVYISTSDSHSLRNLDFDGRQRLIRKYYLPHHWQFAAMADASIEQHGRCLIIDAHSFASAPLPHEPDQRPDRPEICIGTDEFHTGESLRLRAQRTFADAGFETALNVPFSGAIVPIKHFGRDSRVESVMIEVNRKCYMDESTGERRPDFNRFCDQFQQALKKLLFEDATANTETPFRIANQIPRFRDTLGKLDLKSS